MILHAIVHGRVQGVGFRYFVKNLAQRFNLPGWARNCPDGTVEVEVEGNENTLREFEEGLRGGSTFSRVDSLDSNYVDDKRGHLSFSIRG